MSPSLILKLEMRPWAASPVVLVVLDLLQQSGPHLVSRTGEVGHPALCLGPPSAHPVHDQTALAGTDSRNVSMEVAIIQGVCNNSPA